MEAYLIVRHFSDWDDITTNVMAVFMNKDAAESYLERCRKTNEEMIANNVERANCVSYELEVADLNPTEVDIW